MLPVRKSGFVPKRPSAVAAEVRVPSTGASFVALAIGIRPDGIALATFHVIDEGTPVEMELTLPDGRAYVQGRIAAGPEGGLAIDLVDVDDMMHMRLEAAGARNAA